jgi:hypothetical protein
MTVILSRKRKQNFSLFPLPDKSMEAESLEMLDIERSAMS